MECPRYLLDSRPVNVSVGHSSLGDTDQEETPVKAMLLVWNHKAEIHHCIANSFLVTVRREVGRQKGSWCRCRCVWRFHECWGDWTGQRCKEETERGGRRTEDPTEGRKTGEEKRRREDVGKGGFVWEPVRQHQPAATVLQQWWAISQRIITITIAYLTEIPYKRKNQAWRTRASTVTQFTVSIPIIWLIGNWDILYML